MPSASWANGWLTGDVVTAAEYRKSVGAIFDTTLGGAAATVPIPAAGSIVGTYAHLFLEVYGRGDTAATEITVRVRVNGDSAANYDNEETVTTAATTVANSEELATAAGWFAGKIAAASATAGLAGQCQVWIPHYAGTTFNKRYSATSGWQIGIATGNVRKSDSGGGWRNAAAITSLAVYPETGNFAAGTRVTLYAMGA